MKLSVRIRLYNDTRPNPARVLAFAELHIDDSFAVKRIRILKKPDRPPFVVFPAEKGEGGQWVDIAHPLNSETRAACLSLILDEYRRVSSR